MNQWVRPSTQADVEFIAQHMRTEDVEEVGAIGLTPIHALSHGLRYSTVSKTLVDPKTGNPGAMLGVVQDSEISGKVWLLGTPAIESNTVAFLRNSRSVMAGVYEEAGVPVLYNFVYCKNEIHIKWLKWLGFVFLRKVELTPGHFFYEFVRLKG